MFEQTEDEDEGDLKLPKMTASFANPSISRAQRLSTNVEDRVADKSIQLHLSAGQD